MNSLGHRSSTRDTQVRYYNTNDSMKKRVARQMRSEAEFPMTLVHKQEPFDPLHPRVWLGVRVYFPRVPGQGPGTLIHPAPRDPERPACESIFLVCRASAQGPSYTQRPDTLNGQGPGRAQAQRRVSSCAGSGPKARSGAPLISKNLNPSESLFREPVLRCRIFCRIFATQRN